MARPKSLKPGARIGICAPSSRISQPNFDNGVKVLQDEGFVVYAHSQCFKEYGQIAGSTETRAGALNDLLYDDLVDAIIFACGGHRAAEIIPLLDWKKLEKTPPKIIMGFSDISMLLHAFHARLNWTTFFGPMVQHIGRTRISHPQSWAKSKKLLQGGAPSYELNYGGKNVEGKLMPVTLSLLPLLANSDDLADLKGAILCIEDINEELSAIDRMLLHLKRRGMFDQIGALVLGEFTGTKDSESRPFGFTIEEMARHHAGNDLPIATNAPFGHGDTLYALPVGSKARLEENKLTIDKSVI